MLRILPILFLLALPTVAHAQMTPETAAHLQRATVSISSDAGCGSGIVCRDPRGGPWWVWTAAHVIGDESTVTLVQCTTREDGTERRREFKAKARVVDHAADIAVLEVIGDGEGLESIRWFERSDHAPIGRQIFMAASPSGPVLAGTVHAGTQAGVGRIHAGQLYDQAAIHTVPGASGGAICLPDGRCIGMVQRAIPSAYVFYAPARRLHLWRVQTAFLAHAMVPRLP